MRNFIKLSLLAIVATFVFSTHAFAQQQSYTVNLGVITTPTASGSNQGGSIGSGSCTLQSSASNATISVNYPTKVGYGGYTVSWTITAKSTGSFSAYYKVTCLNGASTVSANISGTYQP